MSAMLSLDALLALLLLLPAAWLALPMTLAGQQEAELTATGWWVLLQLAPAMVLIARRPRTSLPVTMYAGFVALSLLSTRIFPPSDTLSSSRALLVAIASWSAFSAGSTLAPAGRRVLSIGLIVLSIAFSLPALLGVSARVQGALQNSGATSEAALLGALAALAWCKAPSRLARAAAWVAILSYAAFVALAPVIAGALVFAVLAALAWFLRREDRRSIAFGLGAFLLMLAATLGISRVSEPAADPNAAAAAPARGHFGGFAVRAAIAPRVLAMLADDPWLGSGPGQFRARFPLVRSESERSESNRANPPGRESEVEHAHDDFLTTLAEVGLLGGLLWCAVLLWLSRAAIGALRSAERERAALGIAVLAGVLASLLRAPLTFNPASASLFFAAAGGLIARDATQVPAASNRRWIAILGLALLASQAPRAWAFVRHGNALRLPGDLDPAAALIACPDSPLALSLQARKLAADPARSNDARTSWERVLELRPYNFEALVQAGVQAAKAHDVQAAVEHWQRALQVAPERTEVLQNLLLLEARHGDDAQYEHISQRARGRVERAWAIGSGAESLLSGDERTALRLWNFAAVDWTSESAQQLYDRSREHPEEPSRLKSSWEMLAHLRWAREHALTGDFTASVRSYRQALRLAPDASSARLELAAALWKSDKHDEARTEIERAKPRAEDWTRIDPWAGEVLLEAGLFAQ